MLTAFVLIPNLGVNKAFTLGALLLLLVSGIYSIAWKKYYQVPITLLIVVISLYLLSFHQKTLAKDDLRQIIYQTHSLYGQLKVVEIPRSYLRAALIDGALQSRVFMSDSHNSGAMWFTDLFTRFLSTYQRGRGNALIIGLGASVIPRLTRALGYQNDVVEIDPKVETMAKNYFDFTSEFG
ncbi:MAG: hypothetical protein ACREOW_04370 [Thermodesulfobacteriota bacterium]